MDSTRRSRVAFKKRIRHQRPSDSPSLRRLDSFLGFGFPNCFTFLRLRPPTSSKVTLVSLIRAWPLASLPSSFPALLAPTPPTSQAKEAPRISISGSRGLLCWPSSDLSRPSSVRSQNPSFGGRRPSSLPPDIPQNLWIQKRLRRRPLCSVRRYTLTSTHTPSTRATATTSPSSTNRRPSRPDDTFFILFQSSKRIREKRLVDHQSIASIASPDPIRTAAPRPHVQRSRHGRAAPHARAAGAATQHQYSPSQAPHA